MISLRNASLRSTLSPRRLGVAGVAAAVGCAAWCALPLLAAVGVGGGLVGTLGSALGAGTDLLVAAIVFAGALGTMALRDRRRREAPRGPSCDADGRCCERGAVVGADREGAPRPLVCTLDAPDRTERAGEFAAAFVHLTHTERTQRGFRWHFRPVQGLEARLVDLARREHACCRFLELRVAREGDSLVCEVTADESAGELLSELMSLPEALENGADQADVERSLRARGLAFACDRGEPPPRPPSASTLAE